MKAYRAVAGCLAAALLLMMLCGCSNTRAEGVHTSGIVCLRFPEYDWTRNILGENPAGIPLRLLAGSGMDMHSYQATVDDIALISGCELLICTGGSSENWVIDATDSSRDASLPSIVMMRELDERLLDVETSSTMEQHDVHAHEHAGEADEHVWLSLRNAELACQAIARELCALDPDHAAVYQANLDGYVEKLQALDAAYETAIDSAVLDTVLFADRFPFLYLMQDYDLQYYAAFSGCSADVDASFETIVSLINTLDSLNLPAVLILDGSSAEIADAVIANVPDCSCEILTLDSMQSVTAARVESGETYLSIMQRNLDTLSQALNPVDKA